MRSLIRRFFSEEDEKRIRAHVDAAERRTAGELVPMIVSASGRYSGAASLGAMVVGFSLAFLANAALGFSRWWHGLQPLDVWLFPAVFGVAYLLYLLLATLAPTLKRPFISAAEMTDEVEESSFAAFYRHGLARTRERTGILLFISIFERKVRIVADEGIHHKVGEESWKRAVEIITGGFRRGSPTDALCEAIDHCAALLAEHFPRKSDDTDELDNLIVDE